MKKILVPNFIHTRPREEYSEKKSKKNQKIKIPLSSNIYSQNRDDTAQEREKKILVPNFVHTRLGQENSKQNSKKIQKIKKVNSGFISIQKGLREAEKERKKF